MSCQPLFIEFLASFCHHFGALLSVSFIQKSFWEVPELYEKELTRYRDGFVEVSEKKKKIHKGGP
jgi:hypothetical protein